MRESRTYSVFCRDRETRKWVRLSGLAMKKSAAVRIFQGMLLSGSIDFGLEMELKPAAEDLSNSAKYRAALDKYMPRPEAGR